ncbi:MAG: hypothetical protein M3P33_03725 [bacterium]|nr:hypothetical protein [bacterium]
MKPPTNKIIYKTKSAISGEIKVAQRGSSLVLLVNDVKQSVWSLDASKFIDTYWEAVTTIPVDILTKEPRILILGTGGATIPKLFTIKYPKSEITCIEIDKEIINIANKYFDVENYKQINIINDDAHVWLKENKDKYYSYFDIICLDTFLSETFSLDVNDDNLITILHIMKNSGVFITNRIYGEEFTQKVQLYISYLGNYFSEIRLRTIAGFSGSDNIIIFAKNDFS